MFYFQNNVVKRVQTPGFQSEVEAIQVDPAIFDQFNSEEQLKTYSFLEVPTTSLLQT